MAPAYFMHEGILFNSSEQCYQYTKALYQNEDDLANDILVLTDAYECKRLGGKDDVSDEWVQKREEIMATIIKEKFVQNDDLADVLLSTGPAMLYEATTDQFWGIGSTLFTKTTHQETGKGINKLGLLLMALRKELGGEGVPDPPSAQTEPVSAPAPSTAATVPGSQE